MKEMVIGIGLSYLSISLISSLINFRWYKSSLSLNGKQAPLR